MMVLVAVVIWSRYRLFARLLMFLAWFTLALLSLPIVSTGLFSWLERPYLETAMPIRQATDTATPRPSPEIIVVLGGGRMHSAPEHAGRDQVSHQSLWRLRYAATLAKEFELPVIASGGTVYPYEQVSEAALADEVLRNDFGLSGVIQEGLSRNTWENAYNTASLLEEKGLKTVFLVTHAYHMRRAEFIFREAGVNVVPVATGFFSTKNDEWWDAWLPTARALSNSKVALHEYLGLGAYYLKTLL